MTTRQVSARSILLIEDDADIHSMLIMLLQRKGYSVTGVSFGQDALIYLAETETLPELILLDLRLPDMGGNEVYHLLQNDPRLMNIPVILMTAEPSGPKVAHELGVFGFLAKPFTPVALLQLTESICSPA